MAPKLQWIIQEMITHRRHVDAERLAWVADLLVSATLKLSIVLVTGSVLVLLLAAWCTLMLVFVSRRATLRQVNANLAVISAQIKLLQPPTR